MYVNGKVLGPDGRPWDRNAGTNGVGGFSGEGYGDQFPLPHIVTFNQILMSGDRAYWHDRWDEAMRFTRESALVMKRDAFLISLLNERKHAVASVPWDLEIPDEKDPVQRLVRDTLKRAIENIADLRSILWALLDAIWYGRQGVELEWEWTKIRGGRILTVADWIPINGDKLGWNFDAIPYVLINSGVVREKPGVRIINTTAGGRGLLLDGTWRDHFLIHRHERRDGDYFDGESAAGVWGVGIRSDIFWLDWIRRNYLEWITTFLERVGLGVTLWYYEGSNPAALASVQQAALNQSRRANLFVPVFTDGKGSPKGLVERLEVPVNGVDALRMLKEDIEQKIERYVVGQEASSKGEGASGLGNQASAEFQQDTKRAIALWDASNLSETLTGNARNPGLVYLMQRWSFPDTMPDQPNGFRVKWKFGIEKQDSDKKLDSIGKLISFGLKVKTDETYAAAGLTKPDPGDDVIEAQQVQPGGQLPGGQPPGNDAEPPAPMSGAEGEGGDFEPPYPDGEESVDAVLGEGSQADLMERRSVPWQYAVEQKQIARDMLAKRQNAAISLPNKPAPSGWTTYHGVHGGVGWKNSRTGKVLYATSGRDPFGRKKKGKEEGEKRVDPQQTAVRRKLNAMALARWYVDHWNLLDELNMQPTRSEKHEAGLELYGSGVSLYRPEEGQGPWQVIEHDKQGAKQEPKEPKQYSFNPQQARVPAGAGPIIIGGREFKGGEFVPKEFEQLATPAQKKAIHGSQTGSAEDRMGRGPADTGKIQAQVGPHKEKELPGHQLRHSRQAYKALMAHHGELLMHRIEELTADTQQVLDTMPNDEEHAEIRKKFEERMASYGHMVDWAKEQGMFPEEEPETPEPEVDKPSAKPEHLVEAVTKHGGKHNLANLADIRDELKHLSREQQDDLIHEAMKKGLVTPVASEGRRAGEDERHRTAQLQFPHETGKIGYLSKRLDKESAPTPSAPTEQPKAAPSAPQQPAKSTFGRTQRQGIASILATSNLESVLKKIATNEYLTQAEKDEAAEWAKKADKQYKKRDGFVPRSVIDMINAP